MSTPLAVLQTKARVRFDLEEWKSQGKRLMSSKNIILWDLGDWLLKGKDKGRLRHKELKRHAERITGYPVGTLNNYMTVSKVFEDISRRRENLSYSHHREVSKFESQAIQEELLNDSVTFRWSVRELQNRIRDREKEGTLPKTAKVEKPSKPDPKVDELVKQNGVDPKLEQAATKRSSAIKVQFTEVHKQFLKAISNTIRRTSDKGTSYRWHPDEVVHTIVCEWLKDNVDFLLSQAGTFDERWFRLHPIYHAVLTNPPGYHQWLQELFHDPAEREAERRRWEEEFRKIKIHVQRQWFQMSETNRNYALESHFDQALEENFKREEAALPQEEREARVAGRKRNRMEQWEKRRKEREVQALVETN